MRMAFGLVAILVTIFIMVYVFSMYTHQTSPAMMTATKQANQIAGRSSNGVGIGQQGRPVLEDSKFTAIERDGKLTGMTVAIMPATNGLAEYFGLAVGDVITGIGPFKMGDETLTDEESARNWIQEGMQRQMTMNVVRGGQQITLPADRNTPVPAAPPAPPLTSAQMQAAQQAEGRGPTGQPVLQGADFSPIMSGDKVIGLKVAALPADNGLAQYFGLAVGDVIHAIGPLNMGEQNLDTEAAARTKLAEAYQRQVPIYVDRNQEHLTLPAGSKAPPRVTNSRGAAENLRDSINRQQNQEQ